MSAAVLPDEGPLATIAEEPWRLWPAGYAARIDPAWSSAPHLEMLSAKIVETVFGDKKRLIVTMPPRHGKSTEVDVATPCWYFDLFPERDVMLATYGAEFSESWGQDVRDALRTHPDLFRVRVRRDTTAKSGWRTTSGGIMHAMGVGGPLTGKGAHLLIIDDPHKNWEEAYSVVYRDKVWNWWRAVARTRLEAGGAVIVVMTRWHEDDFVGRLLEQQGDRWSVLNLPALAEPDDMLGRKVGDALWPDRITVDDLLETKEEIGSQVFEAMYQQNPTPPEGTILKRAWWKFYDRMPGPRDWDEQIQSWDMSFKDSEGADFVVCQVWGRIRERYFLIDQIRDRMSFVQSKALMRAMHKKWPLARAKYVEESANGPAIIDDLQSSIPGLLPVRADRSKTARVTAISPYVESGNCYLPTPHLAHWVVDFIDETSGFPNMPNDDQVDAFSQALSQLTGTRRVRTTRVSDQRDRGRR